MPIPKPKAGEEKSAFISRCMANPTMREEYGQEQRYAICNQAWSDRTANNMSAEFLQNISTELTGNLRHEKMEGRDYLVAPVVMIVEGVLNGSRGPVYYPGEELDDVEEVWNHKPVIVYHPEEGVSACDPDILTNRKIGVILNTKYVREENAEGVKVGKLKAEVWMEEDRIKAVDERVWEAVENGTKMEVSTGLFLCCEEQEGEFNGKPYWAVARNYRPDHLAILPDKVGACSVVDGAGLFQNEKKIAQNELSYEERREGLLGQLNVTSPEEHVWVEDIFDDYFIYDRGGRLFRMNYSVVDDKIQLQGVPEEVVRRYEYIAVSNDKRVKTVHYEKGSGMERKEIVQDLIANGIWKEEDREFLLNAEEKQLQLFKARHDEALAQNKEDKPEADPPQEDTQEDTQEGTREGSQEEPVANTRKNKIQALNEYLDAVPAEVREVVMEGLQARSADRGQFIATITANEKNTLSEEQLKSLPTENLRAMAALAEKPKPTQNNYAGQADIPDGRKEDPLTRPVWNFDNIG